MEALIPVRMGLPSACGINPNLSHTRCEMLVGLSPPDRCKSVRCVKKQSIGSIWRDPEQAPKHWKFELAVVLGAVKMAHSHGHSGFCAGCRIQSQEGAFEDVRGISEKLRSINHCT